MQSCLKKTDLYSFFSKIQGKLIKEISSVCLRGIFTSITYLLITHWQNWNRNFASLMSEKRILNVPKENALL